MLPFVMLMQHIELLERILVGTSLGGVIGYERDRHQRPVGLRTHAIVAMASSTFMVVSTHFVYFQDYHAGDFVAVDPSRIAASVVAGIGFLAGGSILRSGATIQGITTAAALWLVTAIGLCAGGGMYVEAAFTTALGVGALTLLRRFEDKDVIRRRISIVLGENGESVATLHETLGKLGVVFANDEYERKMDGTNRTTVIFDARFPMKITVSELVDAIEKHAGVISVRVQTTS
jgi:putative Mg2+ transporter-C (MgtC) family protein